MVVPDDITFDNVPQITGLLTYQKDAEILRLRKTESWKAVAEEEMVKLPISKVNISTLKFTGLHVSCI